jgi:hypothetical protein
MSKNKNIDFSKIIRRLELIKSLISLEEESEILTHISKLEQIGLSAELDSIILCLKEKSYGKAVTAIEMFIAQHNSLVIFIDPEIEALKLEIKSFEATINSLSDEKAELEKLIHEFSIRHNKELGELIIKILQYRKDHTKGTPQHQEAEDDFNSYHQEYESTKNAEVVLLTVEEQKEIKDKYRKASKLCHPDVVSDEQKGMATKIFAELSIAFENNDINRVKEIYEGLETGNIFISKSDAISEKKLLLAEVHKQRMFVKELQLQLQALKDSGIFKKVSAIENWDEYFKKAKQNLQSQLINIENERK